MCGGGRGDRSGEFVRARRDGGGLGGDLRLALAHVGDSPGGISGAGAPAFHIGLGGGEAGAGVLRGAFDGGAGGARLGNGGAAVLRLALEGGDGGGGGAGIGQRRESRGGGFMVARGFVPFGCGPRSAGVEVGTQPGEPLDLGGGAVLPGTRVACRRIGAGELLARGARSRAGRGDRRFLAGKIGFGHCHALAGSGERFVDRGEAVEAFEPLGSRGAALFRDITVPAAELAGPGDEAFARGERALIVGVEDDDVGEAGGEERRRGNVVDEAVGRSAGTCICGSVDIRPIGVGLLIETDLEVVAQCRGEGAFIAGGGADMIEQAVAALAFGGAAERRGLAVECGEIRASGGAGGLRCVSRGEGGAFIGLCLGLGGACGVGLLEGRG